MSTIAQAALDTGALRDQSRSAAPAAATPSRSSVSASLSLKEYDVSFDAASVQSLSGNGGPLDQFRFQSLSAGMRSVELTASASRFSNGILETAGIIYRRASFDISLSSGSLERYARQAAELENIDPKTLQDYLALIKMLDEQTPESLDPFFQRLRNILDGSAETVVAQPDAAAVDINVPVDPGAGATEQVQQFFFSIHVSATSLSISLERQVQQSDPLVLDLNGNGIELSSWRNGRQFDINADGSADRTAFVSGGDAFLALDRNGNGAIDDGSELFGDQHGARDGFAELAKYDDNRDAVIDNRDAVYARLSLFDGAKLGSLVSAGIASLSLAGAGMAAAAVNGNPLLSGANFTRLDGSSGKIADVLLNFNG